MYSKSSGIASYGRVASFEKDPFKQIVMLYDGAIKFLHAAAADIEAGDMAAKANHTNRAMDIIDYLQSILDLEKGGEVGRSLDDLYTKVRLQILKASAGPDAVKMRNCAELLRPVRNAWEENSRRAVDVPSQAAAPANTTAQASFTRSI